MRIKKESIMFNSINQKPPKIKMGKKSKQKRKK
jgi:hypothetical protein